MSKILMSVLFVLAAIPLAMGGETAIKASRVVTATASYHMEQYVSWHGNYYGAEVKNFWQFPLESLASQIPDDGSIQINSATLVIHGEHQYPGTQHATQTIYETSSDWLPDFTTANAPAFGDEIGTFDFPSGFTGVYIDCKDYLQSVLDTGDTVISFGGYGISDYVDEIEQNMVRMIALGYPDTNDHYAPRLDINYTIIVPPTAEKPVISPRGSYDLAAPATFTISITHDDPTAVIRYTIDGTEPDAESPIYSTSFTVSSTTVVKAKAWIEGMRTSPTARMTYQYGPIDQKLVTKAVAACSATYIYSLTDPVTWHGNYSGQDVRNFWKFSLADLPQLSGGSITINSAYFRFFGEWNGNSLTLPLDTVYLIPDTSWTPGTFTLYEAPEFGEKIDVYAFPGGYQPLNIDVSDYVQAVLDNEQTAIAFGSQAPNIYVDEIDRNFFRNIGLNYGSDNDHYAPKLYIDYTLNVTRAAKPVISPAGGAFLTNQTVTITCDTAGAEIRYTDDGSEPTESSTLYTAPFTVVGPKLIKAMAFPPSGSELYMSEVASAFFDETPTAFNNPVEIKQTSAAIVCDGDLTEWTDAEWAVMDQPYDGNAIDILEAYYAAKWSADGTKIYVAVKIKDSTHVFTDTYDSWNTRDGVEICLRTNGYSDDYTFVNSEPAQQYSIGIKNTDRNAVWTAIGAGSAVPSVCEFTAGGKEDGDWLYYEVAMTPFQYMGALLDKSSVSTPVVAGQVINLDVVAAGNNGMYTGMKSENMLQWKSQEYTKFGLHKLVATLVSIPGDANRDGMVNVGDLGILAANYGGSDKTWEQGDFNNDGLVNVGDLGILAANYGAGVNGAADFAGDYAKVFGSAVEDDDSEVTEGSSLCSGLGLPLLAGLLLAGLMLVKLEE
ncbi:MAG: hypothetical protein GX629_01425 [Phycisphaerae bacterium]|nr:hypothetical protein [Phycisphaerae bacterium]